MIHLLFFLIAVYENREITFFCSVLNVADSLTNSQNKEKHSIKHLLVFSCKSLVGRFLDSEFMRKWRSEHLSDVFYLSGDLDFYLSVLLFPRENHSRRQYLHLCSHNTIYDYGNLYISNLSVSLSHRGCISRSPESSPNLNLLNSSLSLFTLLVPRTSYLLNDDEPHSKLFSVGFKSDDWKG